jgi:hypothetical protein
MKLQIGQTVRRTSLWDEVVVRDLQSEQEIANYYAMQKEGFTLEVLIDGTWHEVSRPLTIHRAAPESCAACEA